MNIPNFARRRRKLQPVRFVAVEKVFKAQIKVRATRDLNGWANRDRRVKWHIGAGRVGCLDEDTAREFQTKGFVEILDGTVRPVSEAEAEEFLSQVKTITMGS